MMAMLSALDYRLDHAIGQVSIVAQATGGSLRRRRGIDLTAELERASAAIQFQLEEIGGRMLIEASPGEVLRAEVRPENFAAIFHALARNSIDWARNGKPLRITAQVRNADDVVEVLFSDNGRGVLPALEQTLFDPMVTGREEGAGMGLTLARSIATSHGGSLSLLVDRRRRGATFVLQLPRKKSRATAG